MDESTSSMMSALRPHRALIAEFVSGLLSADSFETKFLTQYKADSTRWTPDLFDILDGLFFDVDDYVSDDGLRSEAGGLDAVELRVRAKTALQRLDRYALEAGGGSTGNTG